MELMEYITIYLSCVAGIIFSVFLPIAVKWLHALDPTMTKKQNVGKIFVVANPYIKVVLASLFIGVVVVVSLASTLTDLRLAFMAGLSWDTIIQKITDT